MAVVDLEVFSRLVWLLLGARRALCEKQAILDSFSRWPR